MKTQRVKLVGNALSTGATGQRRQKRRLSAQQRRYILSETGATEVNLIPDDEVAGLQSEFFGDDLAEMMVKGPTDFLGAEVVSLEQLITREVPYTPNRGHISTLIREQKGFTRVTNKNGDFVAISVDSFERMLAEGYQLVKLQEPEGDNLAMFRGCGEPDKLDLPLPDYQYRQPEISEGRRRTSERILLSGNDDNAEYTG